MQISVSSQTTLQNTAYFFGFALYDASAPTVLLENQIPPKPYGNPIQITFLYSCLSGHTYIIKLWESFDGSPTGVVRNSFSQQVNASSILVRMPEYLQVGVTAGLVAGATSYVDATLSGWDYKLFRNGSLQVPDSSADSNPPYHKDATGFSLIQAGDIFGIDERFALDFEAQVIPANPGTPSNVFSAGEVITTSATLTTAQMNKALLIQSATSNIALGFPSLAMVADFAFFYLYSIGGNHINAVFNGDGTDKILFPTDVSSIILGQCEILKVFKAFGKWNVDQISDGVLKVGELLYNYALDEINTLQCAGQTVNRADYPRLWAWVQSLGSGVVTDSVWTSTFITDALGVTYHTEKGNFSTGNTTTTFRLPLLTNAFLRAVDGTARLSASWEYQTLMKHGHRVNTGGNGTGANPGKSLIRQSYSGDGYGSQGTGAGSGGPYIEIVGDNESKPTNQGAYLLIRI